MLFRSSGSVGGMSVFLQAGDLGCIIAKRGGPGNSCGAGVRWRDVVAACIDSGFGAAVVRTEPRERGKGSCRRRLHRRYNLNLIDLQRDRLPRATARDAAVDLLALKTRIGYQRLTNFTALHIFVVSLRCSLTVPSMT